MTDSNPSVAAVRWTVARRRLDGGDTLIPSSPISSTKKETSSFGMRFSFSLCPNRTQIHLNARLRWNLAGTSSKTGGYIYFLSQLEKENAKRVPYRPPSKPSSFGMRVLFAYNPALYPRTPPPVNRCPVRVHKKDRSFLTIVVVSSR